MKAIFFQAIAALTASSPSADEVRIVFAPDAVVKKPLQMRVGGRVIPTGRGAAPEYLRQWPGTYFETAFRGTAAYFKVGRGDVILHALVDGRRIGTLVKPKPGLYRIEDLESGHHILRIEIASESQKGPTSFGGFYSAGDATPGSMAPRRQQIEFIGDSHTVGYGNTSLKRECTEDEVWATTDTSSAVPVLTAKHFGADYQVNAISGRGIVRNYNGFKADTLPRAYPYILFNKGTRYRDPSWQPEVIVISLGTNDFTTALRAGEKWKTRAALREDYEKSYVRFVEDLRARNPKAFFILWATDLAEGEIDAEVRKVVDRLRAAGETRIAYVPVKGLALSGCNWHPSLVDNRRIADTLITVIEENSGGA